MKGHRPEVDASRCVGCGTCALACVSMVLEAPEGRPVVQRPDWCSACLHCVSVCPTGAITVPPFELVGAPPMPRMDPDALLRLLRERRSVRRTTGEPVSRELLERLIDAGRYAPTGTNAQNLGWIVFETPESVLALRERVVRFYAKLFRMARHAPGRLGLRLMAGEAALRTLVDYLPAAEEVERRLARGEDRLTHHAPAFMLVHGPAEDPCSPFNGAVALYHASLLAHTLGLGCCFNGFVQNAVNHDRALATEIGIPDGNVCVGAMGLGHADPRLRYRRLPERRVPPVLWR